MYYHAYLLLVFDYCSVVWGKTMSCSNKLHKLHARIMRLVDSTASENAIILQKGQKWLIFSESVKYHTAQLVFKTKCDCLPTYMNHLISFSSNSVYGLWSIARNDMNIPKSRTSCMKYSVSILCSKYIECCSRVHSLL